jgi:hypothetical protein
MEVASTPLVPLARVFSVLLEAVDRRGEFSTSALGR